MAVAVVAAPAVVVVAVAVAVGATVDAAPEVTDDFDVAAVEVVAVVEAAEDWELGRHCE